DCVRGLTKGLDRQVFDKAFSNAFGGRALQARGPEKPPIVKSKYRNPGDAALVSMGLELIRAGTVANPFQAAKHLCPVLDGKFDQQKIDRLRKAISSEMKSAKDRQS